jgi:hypothetical protein
MDPISNPSILESCLSSSAKENSFLDILIYFIIILFKFRIIPRGGMYLD